jgi:hypothetical protein
MSLEGTVLPAEEYASRVLGVNERMSVEHCARASVLHGTDSDVRMMPQPSWMERMDLWATGRVAGRRGDGAAGKLGAFRVKRSS